MQGQIATLEQRMDNLLARVALNESSIAGVENSVALLQNENTKLGEMFSDLQSEVTSLEQVVSDLELANTEIRAEIEEYGDLTGELALDIEANQMIIDTLAGSLDDGLQGLQHLIELNEEAINSLLTAQASLQDQLIMKQNVIDSACSEGFELTGFDQGAIRCVKKSEETGPIQISQVVVTKGLAINNWYARSDSDKYLTPRTNFQGTFLASNSSDNVKANQIRAGCPAGSYLMGGDIYEYPDYFLEKRVGGDSGLTGNPTILRMTVDAKNLTVRLSGFPYRKLNPLWQPYVSEPGMSNYELIYWSVYLLCAGVSSTDPIS